MNKQKILFYILNRVLLGILVIFIITTLVFLFSQIIPGGPFDGIKNLSGEIKKIQEEIYGLNKPIIIQYLLYLKNIFFFNFGISIHQRGTAVTKIINDTYKYSLYVGLSSALLAFILGVLIGCLAAVKNKKTFDKIVTFLTLSLISVPLFIVACLCNKTLSGFFSSEGLTRFFLPVIVLSIPPLCSIIRLTKSTILTVLNTNYIKAIRAKGASEKDILIKHALPNSIVPIISYMGPMFADIITGNIIVEHSFNIPGVGGSYVSFIYNKDYPVIMGMTIFFTTIIVIAILISDILCIFINPNIDIN